MSNQEGKVYRMIDEAENSPRRAQGSAEVDGSTERDEKYRSKYRIGNARGKGKEGDRSRMKLRDFNPDPEKVQYYI
jgi:hypothetical protein